MQRSQSLSVTTGNRLFRHCGDRANLESVDFAGSADKKGDSSRKHRRAPVRAVASFFNSRSKGKGSEDGRTQPSVSAECSTRAKSPDAVTRHATDGDLEAEGDVQATSNCGTPRQSSHRLLSRRSLLSMWKLSSFSSRSSADGKEGQTPNLSMDAVDVKEDEDIEGSLAQEATVGKTREPGYQYIKPPARKSLSAGEQTLIRKVSENIKVVKSSSAPPMSTRSSRNQVAWSDSTSQGTHPSDLPPIASPVIAKNRKHVYEEVEVAPEASGKREPSMKELATRRMSAPVVGNRKLPHSTLRRSQTDSLIRDLENAIAIRKSSPGWSGNSNVIATPKARSQERSAKASQGYDSGIFSRDSMVSCPSTGVSSSGEDSLSFSPIQGSSLCAWGEESFPHTLASDSSVELDLSETAKKCGKKPLAKSNKVAVYPRQRSKTTVTKPLPIPLSRKKQGKDDETIYEFVVSTPTLRVRVSLENDVPPVPDVENHYSAPPNSVASNHPELSSSNLQSYGELLSDSVYSRLCFYGQSTPSPVFLSSPNTSTSSCSRNPSTSSCYEVAVLPTQDEEDAGDGTGGHTFSAHKDEGSEQTDDLAEQPADNTKGHRIRSHTIGYSRLNRGQDRLMFA